MSFCWPPLNIEATLVIFQLSGKMPVAKERLKILQRDSSKIGSQKSWQYHLVQIQLKI